MKDKNRQRIISRNMLIGTVLLVASLGVNCIPYKNKANAEARMLGTPSNMSINDAKIQTPSNAEKREKDLYTGFKTYKGKTSYYMDGERLVKCFAVIDRELYYFDEYGNMVIGWFYDKAGDAWYYFDNDGISIDGWIHTDSEWQYLEDKKLLTGWKEIPSDDGQSYWFCFDEEGNMYADCKTPDGYYVNEDGVYIPEGKDGVFAYDDGFEWIKGSTAEPGQLSGLQIADHPAEFYMLCIAGETSGLSNLSAVKNGDRGCAYGACQLDYRYDLVGFMQFAYEKHPELWSSFAEYINYKNGSSVLKGNKEIGNAFIKAMTVDYETAMTDQLEYMSIQYWDGFAEQMNSAGFNLEERHVAVSAALFSVNVNCGPQANVFIRNLSPEMSDEELIRGIYKLRNTVFARQKVGRSLKGTTTRYRKSEPQMALDLLFGYVTIDSDVAYGGGVEWHGNPFSDTVTTIALDGNMVYEEPSQTFAVTATTNHVEKAVVPKPEGVSETNPDIIEPMEQIENTEEMARLIDGTLVNREEYGPGYEYMETEASEPIEETETPVLSRVIEAGIN